MLDHPAQRIADGTAVATGALAGVSWTLSDINTMMSIGAGAVAILTGIAATIWYVLRIRAALKGRDDQ